MTSFEPFLSQVTSYVSSLQYLKGCTSTYVMPSPSILHKLLTEHLLDQVSDASQGLGNKNLSYKHIFGITYSDRNGLAEIIYEL